MSEIKETIEQLEKLKEHCESMQEIDGCTYYTRYTSAIDTAVAIIRNEVGNETD